MSEQVGNLIVAMFITHWAYCLLVGSTVPVLVKLILVIVRS